MSKNKQPAYYARAMRAEVTPDQYWSILMQTGSRLLGDEFTGEYADRTRAAGEYLGALFDVADGIVGDKGQLTVHHAVVNSRPEFAKAHGLTHDDMLPGSAALETSAAVQGMDVTVRILTDVVHELGHALPYKQ